MRAGAILFFLPTKLPAFDLLKGFTFESCSFALRQIEHSGSPVRVLARTPLAALTAVLVFDCLKLLVPLWMERENSDHHFSYIS